MRRFSRAIAPGKRRTLSGFLSASPKAVLRAKNVAGDAIAWRLAASSTLRGIYVIRYFLFSGGCAIFGALVERAVVPTNRPIAGLLLGFAIGLVIFRGQLRPLWWPWLALSQEAVFLVHKGKAAAIPWSSISDITEGNRSVSLNLARPLKSVEGEDTETIRLEPRQLGIGRDVLASTLRKFARDRDLRARLPSEEQLRQASLIPKG
jgi:hypothetical protein